MAEPVHIQHPAPHVVSIAIDNPPSNALGVAVQAALEEALAMADADLEVRAVVITGRGAAFCAGADLRERAEDGGLAPSGTAGFNRLLERLDALRPATIAAVNGPAFGGGLELALACDIRIAAEGARFAAAGVNVGLMASVYRLPRLIGVARAKAMLLTGSPIDAAQALAWGLVTDIVLAGALGQRALDLAVRIASRAPLSVEASKRIAGRAPDLSPDVAAVAIARELEALTASDDHRAAVAAFAARTEPVFRRR